MLRAEMTIAIPPRRAVFAKELLVNGQPKQVDCLEIAEVARRVRMDNPRADVGSQCSLPENGGAG